MIPRLGGGNSNIFGIFTPKIGEDEPILTHIFQMGWFNHQLVMIPKTWKDEMNQDGGAS